MWANSEYPAFIFLTDLETENLWVNPVRLSSFSGRDTDFWHLWQQYQDEFYSRCLQWMGGNSHDAEDLLSRAMLKAWNQWPNYAGTITNHKAWLRRLIHNLSVDIHRERQRQTEMTDDAVDIRHRESPESEILRHELGVHLCHAIESLAPRLRDPFILRYCQHKSYKDIAQELTLSEDNVWKQVQQARTILRNQLNKYLAGEDETFLNSHPLNEMNSPNLCQQKASVEKLYATSLHAMTKRGQINSLELTSDWEASITTESIVKQINYQVTATCLETLPHNWYSSPSPLGWS
jgi:RNA polymerase sigma factor (sigma-70 family)